eukprot:53076-Chlamydomonas_euryale.AAC.3
MHHVVADVGCTIEHPTFTRWMCWSGCQTQIDMDEPLLVLHKPMRLFGGFDDGVLKASFEAFVDRVAGNWCCRDKPFIDRGMKEKEKLAIVETLLQRDFLDDKGLEGLKAPDPDWSGPEHGLARPRPRRAGPLMRTSNWVVPGPDWTPSMFDPPAGDLPRAMLVLGRVAGSQPPGCECSQVARPARRMTA